MSIDEISMFHRAPARSLVKQKAIYLAFGFERIFRQTNKSIPRSWFGVML